MKFSVRAFLSTDKFTEPVLKLFNHNTITFGELLEYTNARKVDLESYAYLYGEPIVENIALDAYRIVGYEIFTSDFS